MGQSAKAVGEGIDAALVRVQVEADVAQGARSPMDAADEVLALLNDKETDTN